MSNELLDKAELPQISLVIPLLNESESLAELIKRIHDAVSDHYHYEIIFVDDGSTDDSWQVIKELAQDRDIFMVSNSDVITVKARPYKKDLKEPGGIMS